MVLQNWSCASRDSISPRGGPSLIGRIFSHRGPRGWHHCLSECNVLPVQPAWPAVLQEEAVWWIGQKKVISLNSLLCKLYIFFSVFSINLDWKKSFKTSSSLFGVFSPISNQRWFMAIFTPSVVPDPSFRGLFIVKISSNNVKWPIWHVSLERCEDNQ